MKKRIVSNTVPFSFHWTYGVTIEQIRKDLNELEKLGVNKIDIGIENNWGDCEIRIETYTEREETYEEYKERIEKEKQPH